MPAQGCRSVQLKYMPQPWILAVSSCYLQLESGIPTAAWGRNQVHSETDFHAAVHAPGFLEISEIFERKMHFTAPVIESFQPQYRYHKPEAASRLQFTVRQRAVTFTYPSLSIIVFYISRDTNYISPLMPTINAPYFMIPFTQSIAWNCITDALLPISITTLKAIVRLLAKAEYYVQELTASSLIVFIIFEKNTEWSPYLSHLFQ